MKIGIITFWDSQDNYGQIMQSYALNTYLTNAGHEAFIIRYKPYCKKKSRNLLKCLNPFYVKAYLVYRKELKRMERVVGVERDFDSFRKKYVKYTDKVYNGFEQLWLEDWSSFDAFICGSDQIWSPKPEEQLNAYFLQFAPFKSFRIAYAPSFGRKDLPRDYQSQLKKLLCHFDAVSVRESEGVKICGDAGVDCQLVCDPTLLLKKADYQRIVGETKRERSAFCYMIKWDTLCPIDELREYVQGNFDGVSYFCTDGQKRIFEYETNQTIENWILSIQKSQISLTNSFHGVVFSILSHTPFVAFPLCGESAAMNNRLYSLLERLELTSRIYSEGKTIKGIAETAIDWENVDRKLEDFRLSSQDFLSNALSPKKEKVSEHNICFLTRASVHHNYGGLDRVTELLAEYFMNNGAKVYFVSQIKREKVHDDLQYILPNHECFQSEENISWLNDFLESKSIDVVINQEGNVDLTLPIKNGVKRITVLHFNPNYIDDKHFEHKFRNNEVLKFAFKTSVGKFGLRYLREKLSRNYVHQIAWADSFVMLSDMFRKTMAELLPNGYDYKKVLAINNPIVLDEGFKSSEVEKENVILYVGRIDNGFKNVDKLIRIWARVAPQVPDWRFDICGGGGEFEINKQYIEENNIPRCQMLGVVETTQYYKKSQIIIMMSSSSEGWGMVLVEAQQYGCVPIVLNSYASVRDIIQNGYNGAIVESCDNIEEQFAKQLLKLINDEENRKRMMMNSIKSVKRYDINNIGQMWLKLINEK